MGTMTKEREAAIEAQECLGGNLKWLLAQAYYALSNEVAAATEPLGISARACHVLDVARGGEYTQKELAELVGLDKTTMVVTIDELEAAGLAERRPSPTDRRAHVIAVNRAGERKADEARKRFEQVQEDVLSALPAPQRRALLEGLGALVTGPLSEPAACSQPVRRREPRSG